MTEKATRAAGAAFEMTTDGLAGHDLLRTATGGRLHIAPCPHLFDHDTVVASALDRATMPLCDWCDKEVSGHGRTYVDDLDEAMRRFGTYVGAPRLIKAHLEGVHWDQIWMPNSSSYIALGLGGRGAAWIGKGYVIPRRGQFVPLPGYAGSAGGGRTTAEQVWGLPCERCFVQRSLSGACD